MPISADSGKGCEHGRSLDRPCPEKVSRPVAQRDFVPQCSKPLTSCQGYANARQSAPAGRSLKQAGNVRQEITMLDVRVATPAVLAEGDSAPTQALQVLARGTNQHVAYLLHQFFPRLRALALRPRGD